MGIFDWLKKNKKNEQSVEETKVETSEIVPQLETEDEVVEVELQEESEGYRQEPEDALEDEFLEPEIVEEEIEEEPLEEQKVEEPEHIEEVKIEEAKIELEEEPIELLEEAIELPEEPVKEEKKEAKKGFFSKIVAGLDKTRKNILSGVEQALKSFTKIDEELYEELEEALIMADIGVETSSRIIASLRVKVKQQKMNDVADVKNALIEVITEILESGNDELVLEPPTVILVIGVNGVGKTTTIGKLCNNFREDGKTVLLAAADTFRAAAIDQLEVWGKRAGIEVIKHQENSDPGAVVFDAVKAAQARKSDILICDTAGRLHNKKNLMEELRKISKIINRDFPEAKKEVFLVLDATTGQNALQQAKIFKEVADITGIVLTKLDGTAKGGIIIAIKNELNIPIRYIGVGEGINDLRPFDAKEFSRALFSQE